MRQPFSGTAERIFMKLLPNDTGENVVWNLVPPLGESRAAAWRMANVDDCVIYDMSLSQSPQGGRNVIYAMTLVESPEGAAGGCVIQQWAGELK